MERSIPILPADDLRVAKEFYVDRLGFDVRFEATEDGTRGLLGVDRGTISLRSMPNVRSRERSVRFTSSRKTPMRTMANGETKSRFDAPLRRAVGRADLRRKSIRSGIPFL